MSALPKIRSELGSADPSEDLRDRFIISPCSSKHNRLDILEDVEVV